MVFGIKGPKELLATAIAAALAEYFEVDPSKIESNLMVDAKIVLRNVRLRPQVSELQPDPNKDLVILTTTGKVEEVAFTWSWAISSKNKSDSDAGNNSWVRDATLTLKGLDFKTQLSLGSKEKSNRIKRGLPPKSSSSKKLEAIKKEGKLEAYVRDQVEQIIDALTLNVNGFEFTLALPQQQGTSSEISVGGQSVELRSLGRLSDATVGGKGSLKQQLSLGSFYVNVRTIIECSQNASTYPLLSPISYRAVTTRRTGKRFDSFGSGLECIGEPLPSKSDIDDSLKDRGIVFHAGSVQMEVLTHLGNIILASSSPSSPTNEEDKIVSHVGATSNESSSSKDKDDQLESLKQEILTSSLFRFPISGVSLVLPNETKCTLDKFTINFQADGTVMNLQGAEGSGIHINDYPIVATNGGTSESSVIKSRWCVDLISSTFSVAEVDGVTTQEIQEETNGATDTVAFIQCRQDIIHNLMDGAAQVVKAANNLNYNNVESHSEDDAAPIKASSSSSSSNWTVDIQKRVKIRLESSGDYGDDIDDLEGENEQWINMFVGATSIKLPLGPSSNIQCDGLIIGPCSLGNIAICVPAMRQLPGDALLRFDGPVSTVVESSTVAQDLMNFLSGFSGGLGNTSEEVTEVKKYSSDDSFEGLPISVDIPKMDFAILEPSMKVAVKGITAEESSFNITSFEFNDATDSCVSLSEISATLLPKTIEISAKELNTLKIPGTFFLTKPLKNPSVTFGKDSSVDVRLASVDGILPHKVGEAEDATSTTKSEFNLNFPVSLSIGKLTLQKEGMVNEQKSKKLDKGKNEKLFLSVRKCDVSVCPCASKLSESSQDEKTMSDLSVKLHVGEFENQIVQVRELKATMSMNPNDPDEIKELDLAISEPVKIHPGYSTVEWSQMFQIKKKTQKPKSKPMLLPNACIGQLKLLLSADFKIVSQKDTMVGLSAFKGNSCTNSDDVIQYYVDRVMKQAPGMIINVEILGANVFDTSLATYGVYALKSGAYGGAAVGIIGVVGVDGVFGALEAGKKSRGGELGEGYQAGDFIRGLGYSMKEATKAGGAKRKLKNSKPSSGVATDEDKGSLSDFAVGATTGAIEYADKNKARLGGAGAAGIGMVLGTMVAGPVGGIAGGVLVGAATGKSIEGLEKHFGKGSTKSDDDEGKLEGIQEENEDFTPKQNNNRAVTAVAPPLHSISDSIRKELELQTPQGLLYKQRDNFQTQWRPRLFVLHLDSCVLGYHFLSENIPPIVDTNKFNVFNKPALREPDPKGNPIGFEAVPRGILHLSGCRVEMNEKLTYPAKNLFSFTVTPKNEGSYDRPWNLAATTEEARLMWVGMLAEMTGQIEDEKKLAEICGISG